VNQTVIV
jgi:hypothetical protein